MGTVRRHRRGWCLPVALLSLAASAAHAQDLNDLLDAAARHNLDARESLALATQRAAEAREAWFRILPSLSGTVAYTHNQYPAIVTISPMPGQAAERFVIVPEDQLNVSATATVPIINVPAWSLGRESDATSEAASLQAAATALTVQRSVVTTYFDLVGAQRVAQSARESIEASETQLRLTRDRVKAGVASPIDEARSAAELEAKRQTLAEADELAATTAQTIETLTTIRPATMPPPTADALQEEPPQAQWIACGFQRLPALQAADAQIRAAVQEVKSRKFAFIPVVAGSATETLTNATGFVGRPLAYAAGVTFTESFDATQIEAVKVAEAAEAQAQLRADRARDTARDQIVSDWEHVHALIARVRAARKQVDANRVADRILRDRSAAGTAGSLDVQIADRDLFNSDASLIQAEANLAAARAELRLSAGLPWNSRSPDGGGR